MSCIIYYIINRLLKHVILYLVILTSYNNKLMKINLDMTQVYTQKIENFLLALVSRLQ